MKYSFYVFFFFVTTLCYGQQTEKSCWAANADADSLFVRYMPGRHIGLFYYVKMVFVDSSGNRVVKVIHKNNLEWFYKKKRGVSPEDVDKTIAHAIVNNISYNMSDTGYFKGPKINEDFLSSLNFMPVEKVLKQYFNQSGRIKKEYYYQYYMVLMAYLFDKRIVATLYDAEPKIIDRYLGMLRNRGCLIP